MSMLELSGLTVRYGTGRQAFRAVDGIDLQLPPGQVVGLVGESGSGKSTLAKAAVGLAPVSVGQVLLDGEDLAVSRGRAARARRRTVQMVFQDPYSSLDPRMRIGETIAEAIRARDAEQADGTRRGVWASRGGRTGRGARVGRGGRAAEVTRLLDMVSLDPSCAGLLPRALSGGQRQRVALARALAARPSVLIADEITSALDVSVQGSVLNLVRDLQRQLGIAMLFISHNLAVVRYVADTVAVMYCGRIVEVLAAADLAERARHPYTRELLASVPSLHPAHSAALSGGPAGAGPAGAEPAGAEPADPEPADPHHPPSGCRFHPRCPVGPARLPDRELCRHGDPSEEAAARPHRAACFFAEFAPPS
ncbi:MAG: ABC transporter ATP-binding protein [Streptosporangiaceae bacterium]